jgi:1,4-dihydroxy-2-naphthoyl-CoA hydrolase
MFDPIKDLEKLLNMPNNSMGGFLGIEFTAMTSNTITAKMPVDERTKQPFGLLHGGASVVLAETLGSVASYLLLENPATQMAVGLEINANHLSAAKSGHVYGTVEPIHIGKRTHVWSILIKDDASKNICISRITVMII